jgi:hypothetical protein
MSFITPWLAAAGLFAMAIPLAIHLLFRQRRKPVMWGAMRLLQEAFRRHRSRLRLQQFMILALRCLAVAVLGAALAQPLLKSAGLLEGGSSRSVFLVIDDGIASSVTAAGGDTALERSIIEAKKVIESLSSGDSVGLILASHPARTVLSPPSADLAAVSRLLNTIEPSETRSDIDGALRQLASELAVAAKDSPAAAAYLFSEFRQGSAPLDEALAQEFDAEDSRLHLFASPPSQSEASNVQIIEVKPLRAVILPGQTDGSGQVSVKLRRSGGALGREITQVRLGGESIRAIEPRTVHWDAGSAEAAVDFSVFFTESEDREVGLTATIDADPLSLDNQRHAVLESREQIRVTIVDLRRFGAEAPMESLSAGEWIRWALRPAETTPIDLVELEPAALDSRALRVTDAVVVSRPDLLTDQGWTDLREFLDRGGLIVLTPPGEARVHLWIDSMIQTLGLPWNIELEPRSTPEGEALAENQPGAATLRMVATDLEELCSPVRVYRRLNINAAQTQADRVLLMRDGSPLVISGASRMREGETERPSRGQVTLIATAPELGWTNLPSKPLMVPLMQELVREGLGLIRSARSVAVGDRPVISGGRAGQSTADLVGPTDEMIPVGQRGQVDRALTRSGVYRAIDAAGQIVGRLAVNITPAAARTDLQPSDAVLSWLGATGPWSYFDEADPIAPLRTADAAAPLSGYLLPILAFLAVGEAVLAGWWSPRARARIDTSGLRSSVGVPAAGAAA